jgi:hypothetical protein
VTQTRCCLFAFNHNNAPDSPTQQVPLLSACMTIFTRRDPDPLLVPVFNPIWHNNAPDSPTQQVPLLSALHGSL